MSMFNDKNAWLNMRRVQGEITRWATETFPHRTDHHALYKLVLQEIPELLTHKKEHGTDGIGPELADCFILLMDLASLWGVDVAQAIAEKMGINYAREWAADTNGIMQHIVRPRPYILCPQCKTMTHTRLLTEAERISSIGDDDARCIACKITFQREIPF